MNIGIFKKSLQHFLSTALITFALTPAAFADAGDIALTAKGGTLGLGAEVTVGLAQTFNARVGYNTFSYNSNSVQSDIEYDYKVNFKSIPLLVDWHPYVDKGFRVSAGVVINNTEITAATSQSTYTIGDYTYFASQVGMLTGRVDFNQVAPYAGIGWGNALSKGSSLTVVADIGVLFQGTPQLELIAHSPYATNPEFQRQLAKEVADIKTTTDKIKYYPVFSLGLAYKF